MTGMVLSEPVVLCGRAFPALIGIPVANLRVEDARGVAIPFQIDEITGSGDYVGNGGAESNGDSAHSFLQNQDEIVFLWEDADSGSLPAGETGIFRSKRSAEVAITHGAESRRVFIVDDPTIPLSPVTYVSYDERTQYIRTPCYYAQFGADRFHFTRAGIMESGQDRYLDLAKELHLEIVLKTLWGILPIRYNEDNIICMVKRFKAGPIRLIRRGDFYLSLAFSGLRGTGR